MAVPPSTSRLQLMQARFQQKQLQEKEQKLLQLYDQQQQRAHQVAQRGSAGSNDSNGFAHAASRVLAERRQNNAKGIDKSCPLEPLRSKKQQPSVKSSHATNRRNVGRRAADSRESYTSCRAIYKESMAQERGDQLSEVHACRDGSGGDNKSIGRKVNGQQQPNGRRYEINIDEVIDNEAMERNRMLAKFDPAEMERRRRDGGYESERFPEETAHDAEQQARKSNSTTTTKKRSEAAIPQGSGRRSSFMKTTKSASLKATKSPRKWKALERKKLSSLRKAISGRQQVAAAKLGCSCEASPPAAIPHQRRNSGKVKEIVTKIEELGASGGASSERRGSLCARRASFELKRNLFEQLQLRERHDSVDSALRLFDVALDRCSEPVPVVKRSRNCADCPVYRLCKRPKKDVRGFERHTRAWAIRTARRRRVSQSVLEPRDSIELARVARKPKACRRKASQQSAREKNCDSDASCVEATARVLDNCEPMATCVVKRHQTDSAAVNTLTKIEKPASLKTEQYLKDIKAASMKMDREAKTRVANEVATIEQRLKGERAAKGRQMTKSAERDRADIVKNGEIEKELNTDLSLPNEVDVILIADSQETIEKSEQEVVLLLNIVSLAENAPPVVVATAEESARNDEAAEKCPSFEHDDEKKLPNEKNVSSSAAKNFTADRGSKKEDPSYAREEKASTLTPATRTASISSYSSIGPTNRSQGSTGSRPAAKAKTSGATPTPAARTSAPAANVDESLILCKICNRRFTAERITKHEQICAKTTQKKRKQFDTVTHRVKGTELEPFVQKPAGNARKQHQSKPAKVDAPSKSNWRRKHEDFINAIRSAKQMQAHLDAGGKLSDLPPPPPSDTSDYIQCPHCSRKFSQAAAERHVPKCETMQHNKSNTRAQPRTRR